jgi:mycothiol synthase
MRMDQDQLLIRSFSPNQDIPRLLSLYAAVESVDHAENEVSDQALQEQVNAPGSNPLKDRWVVVPADNPSTLVGSALVRASPGSTLSEANIIVHPDWRHHGIASALLSRVMERARQLDATAIQIYASAGQPDAQTFLQKRGFFAQGAYTELRLPEGIRLPPVIWPYGYTMRTYAEVQDISILTEAMNLCYIPLWGHREVSEDEMASWLPGFDQQGLFLVFSEKGRVVGISRGEPSAGRTLKNGQPTGYIDAPGVVPQHRRLDLYRALVLTGSNWLRNQGQSWVEMESWGDKLEVLKMYRELGFKDLRQLLCYQMDLSDGDQADQPVSL